MSKFALGYFSIYFNKLQDLKRLNLIDSLGKSHNTAMLEIMHYTVLSQMLREAS